MPQASQCDVVVIGGGPAGATAAAALARAGRQVILFERDRFPRFHIGESLLASVNEVFDAIGVGDKIRAEAFPKKWGATFITPDGRVERFADFAIADEVPAPQTWQVPRERMDTLLLDHAGASGADVRQGHRVLDVAFDTDGATVTARPPGANGGQAEPITVRARAVVDASGRSGILSRAFSLRVDEPSLANVAIFSHYAGVPRGEGRRSGDIRVVARPDLGWFWMIPISDELMSVGVVLPQAAVVALPKLDPDALLERCIAETPAVARLMTQAERRWPVRVEKDFSFGSRTYAGDRWIIVGDAGSFLDPVFSSGVAIALESALEGARALDRALAANRLTADAFATFNRRQRQRYATFRRFVLGFYTHAFRDLFFRADPPKHMFRAVVTVLAGYWRPSLVTRAWLALFFLSVRLQQRFGFAEPYFME
jgi:flavin-dependent dehydrogenase